MITLNVNWLAIFVVSILSMGVGMFWYSPKGFMDAWVKLTKVKLDKKKKMGPTMAIAFIATLLTAFMMSNFIKFAGATSLASGAQTGFLIWLGFVLPVQLGIVLWENKPNQLLMINAGHTLVNLLIMGAILAVWI